MLLAYNLLHIRKKKEIIGGVSCAIIRHFEHKQHRVLYKILSAWWLWAFLETFLISYLQYYAPGIFNRALGVLLDTGANYFGLIFSAPILIWVACLLLRIDSRAQMDLITPAYPLALVPVKIACYAGGCCCGFEWEHGFYNPITRLIEFPSQLLESAVALIIFIFLLCLKNRMKKGTVFPIYLIVYSGTRFFTEFTRCEPAVFLGLKTYQLLCIAGVVTGTLLYLAVTGYNKTHSTEKIVL